MTVDRYLRLIAGAFVVLSVALGYWVSPYWFLFTAFVGLNLFQSAFSADIHANSGRAFSLLRRLLHRRGAYACVLGQIER